MLMQFECIYFAYSVNIRKIAIHTEESSYLTCAELIRKLNNWAIF